MHKPDKVFLFDSLFLILAYDTMKYTPERNLPWANNGPSNRHRYLPVKKIQHRKEK